VRKALFGVLLLGGCGQVSLGTAAGEGGGGSSPLAQKGLRADACRGDGVLGLTGVWAYRFETRSTVTGSVPGSQDEVATRYGLALLCQDGTDVTALLVTCAFAQTPLRDESGDCAAQLPSEHLLASLPVIGVRGSLDADTVGARLQFDGWTEDWGLEEGAALPAEGSVASADDDIPAGVRDADEDDSPGVTLRGNGDVPTQSWAVRRTVVSFDLGADDEATLAGATHATTDERILGGPAARVLAGRARAAGDGEALFVRADGRYGSRRVDANGDGLLTCGEIGALLYGTLPAPAPAKCR
jgi:hypothetical protein